MLLSELLYLTALAFVDISEMEFSTAWDCHQHCAAWEHRQWPLPSRTLLPAHMQSTWHIVTEPITQHQQHNQALGPSARLSFTVPFVYI